MTFDDDGVELVVCFAGSLRIPWREVKFVCLTPMLERTEAGWRVPRSTLPGADALRFFEKRRVMHVTLVVHDRRRVLAGERGWWSQLYWQSAVRPLLDADGRLQVDESMLHIDVFDRHLDAPRDALLDLISAHARFDLVVFND